MSLRNGLPNLKLCFFLFLTSPSNNAINKLEGTCKIFIITQYLIFTKKYFNWQDFSSAGIKSFLKLAWHWGKKFWIRPWLSCFNWFFIGELWFWLSSGKHFSRSRFHCHTIHFLNSFYTHANKITSSFCRLLLSKRAERHLEGKVACKTGDGKCNVKNWRRQIWAEVSYL